MATVTVPRGSGLAAKALSVSPNRSAKGTKHKQSTRQCCQSCCLSACRACSKSWLCRVDSAEQRSLHSIQAHDPTTASSAQFCLLCYQPEPVPRSLAARLSQLTSRDPCRLQAWLGQAFRTVCRTCTVPPHFNAIVRSDREPRPSSGSDDAPLFRSALFSMGHRREWEKQVPKRS